MYSLIEFSKAVTVEAFVFQTGKNRMRAVVAGLEDALELRRIGSHWFSEYGESVSLEFLAGPEWSTPAPQAMTAAHLEAARSAPAAMIEG